jgi:proline dehydrogenase
VPDTANEKTLNSLSLSVDQTLVERPSISFDNLENTFGSRSLAEIRRAYLLFKTLGNPLVVKLGSTLAGFALNSGLPIKGLIRKTIFSQFCGGEDIADCNQTVSRLAQSGIGSILDYSVEGKGSEAEFEASCREIIATVQRAAGDSHIPFSVFKVTGLARFELLEKLSDGEALSADEDREFHRIRERVNRICEAAFKARVRIFIDAEESWIQPAIDSLATEMMEQYNRTDFVVYNTIQLYRHDRLTYFKDSANEAAQKGYLLGVKLVRGAYMEKERSRAEKQDKPSPIQPDKSASDRDYNQALRFALDHIDRIAICAGTHNEHSSLLLADLMTERGIDPGDKRIYFSQLLGMSDHISFNLAKAGYNVAKYVPYGPVEAVLPYLIRRAQENTSIAGQTGRELSLLTAEMKRRNRL